MQVTIIESSFGLLAFDDKNELIANVLFPKRPTDAAKKLLRTEAGKMTKELTDLITLLKHKGFDEFIFENVNLAKTAEAEMNVHVETSKPSRAGEFFHSRPESFAIKTGFIKDAADFDLWMHNVTMEITKLRVKGAVEKRDLIVAQAVQSLDELDKTINVLMARVREWYGIHFPELDRLLEKHETYARLVVALGNKDNFTTENLEKEDIAKPRIEAITKVAEKSMGADLSEEDLREIQSLCKNITNLYSLRADLESYLDSTMNEVAPNIKCLVGSLLGARLIAISGGLTNLAKRPASTIQVLGAEKALFRSLKTGTRPPKHGLIFQHTLLHDAKKWQRGKIARAVAGKLAIAARADAFGHRSIGDELKADMEKRIDEIHRKYEQAPVAIPIRSRPERLRNRNRRKQRRER
jgi:nucleolar protein 56